MPLFTIGDSKNRITERKRQISSKNQNQGIINPMVEIETIQETQEGHMRG